MRDRDVIDSELSCWPPCAGQCRRMAARCQRHSR